MFSSLSLPLSLSSLLCGLVLSDSYYEKWGCNNYWGLYSEGQCVPSDGTSSEKLICNGTDMIEYDYDNADCSGEPTSSDEFSVFVACQPNQEPCEYAAYHFYDVDSDCQTGEDLWFSSFFIGVCINQTGM